MNTLFDVTVDDEWRKFILGHHGAPMEDEIIKPQPEKYTEVGDMNVIDESLPKCDELNISTKTKVLFLNQEIDIQNIFWEIPILEYWKPETGVVKKQMKIISKTLEEFEEYKKRLENIPYYTEHIIKQINNPAARRIKFKDERKITVGISRKDIMNFRSKVKNAFYNCFAMILRFPIDKTYKEIHVKIFNTGKMEIPGILDIGMLTTVKNQILDILRLHVTKPPEFINNENRDSVLINSNFNCGFYINREKLYHILRTKYNIETMYDSCSYPGVKCKFYFNNDNGFDETIQCGYIRTEDHKQKRNELSDNKRYTEVSFMIFRTGSCLIVGNCSEPILRYIYAFIKRILSAEYKIIMTLSEDPILKNKKSKIRKKMISITMTSTVNA